MVQLLPSQVADARNLPRQLAAVPAAAGDGGANEAQQQIAYSDVVLINKVCLLCWNALEGKLLLPHTVWAQPHQRGGCLQSCASALQIGQCGLTGECCNYCC